MTDPKLRIRLNSKVRRLEMVPAAAMTIGYEGRDIDGGRSHNRGSPADRRRLIEVLAAQSVKLGLFQAT